MEATKKRIARLTEEHKDGLERCGTELAINFDCPANQIIRVHCKRMGITRMDWERIQSLKFGEEFVAPPAHIAARW